MKPIEKAERYTLSKLVVRNLKQYIVEHRLTPGEKLPAERELSQIMNVSRAILREALRSLESAGILEIRHGEGAFICANSMSPLLEQLSFAAQLSGTNGKEMLDIRYLLEAAVIDDLYRQGGILPIEEMERWAAAAAEPGSTQAQTLEADVQFHLALFRAKSNDVLIQLAELLIRQAIETAGGKSSAAQMADEHARYIRAMQKPDAEAAKLVLREHLGMLSSV